MHGAVTATVAKRQHRHLAYLLRNLQHLVGLQIFDDELVGANEVFFLAHGVIDASLRALTSGNQPHVHTDNAIRLDADTLHQRTADETVRAADNVIGEKLSYHTTPGTVCAQKV